MGRGPPKVRCGVDGSGGEVTYHTEGTASIYRSRDVHCTTQKNGNQVVRFGRESSKRCTSGTGAQMWKIKVFTRTNGFETQL